MTRADERDDVGADILLRHAFAGFGILRFQEERENVARAGLAARQQRPSRPDDVGDGAREEIERATRAAPSQTRHERGQAQQIEWIDAPGGVEVTGDGTLELAGVPAEPLAEQRVFQHLERQPGHLFGEIDDAPVALAPQTLDIGARHRMHRRCERHDLARREQGRERATLRAPVLPLRRQQGPSRGPGRSTRNCSSSLR